MAPRGLRWAGGRPQSTSSIIPDRPRFFEASSNTSGHNRGVHQIPVKTLSMKRPKSPPDEKDPLFPFLIILSVLSFVLTFRRIHYGVDLSDEAFYVAIAHRFIQGDRWFVDDLMLHQTFTLITQPLIRLWLFFEHNLDGVVLFLRYWYFALAGIVSALIFWCARGTFGVAGATAMALVNLTYIHYGLPTLSYNTLGGQFSCLTIVLFMRGCIDSNTRLLIFAGLSAGLATVAYPPIAVVFAWLFIAGHLFFRPRRFLGFLWGFCIVVVPFGVWILYHTTPILEVLRIGSELAQTGSKKFLSIPTAVFRFWPYKILSFVGLCIFVWLKRSLPKAFTVLLPLILLVPMVLTKLMGELPEAVNIHSNGFLLFATLLTPILYGLLEKTTGLAAWFWIAWTTSLFAGLTTAWTSSFPFVIFGAGLGMQMGAWIFVGFVTLLAGQMAKRFQWPRGISSIPAALAVCVMLYYQLVVFKDDRLGSLNTPVSLGPYRGLITSAERKEDVETMTNQVRALVTRGRIFVFDSFPAIYVMSAMRPAAHFLYRTCNSDTRERCIQRYREYPTADNLVFHIKRYRYNLDVLDLAGTKRPTPDPVLDYFSATHTKILDNDFYEVYKG